MKVKFLPVKVIVPWIGLMLLFITVPYFIAWIATPPGQVFMNSLINPDDTSVYLSAMRQGSAGHWLFHFNFSPEPLAPRFMYLHYILMGHLAGIVGGSLTTWFHIFRILFSLFTLFSLLFWVRQALPDNARLQLTAWLLIIFGSGIGWLVAILFQPDLKSLPDLGTSEWGVLSPLLGTPHFTLGLGLEALLYGCVIQMRRTRNGRFWATCGALNGVGLGIIYPYNIPVVGLVIGVYLLYIAWQERRIPWRDWLNGAIILLSLLPWLYYYGVWARREPSWNLSHFANNVITPPNLAMAFTGFGLVGILALIGGWRWRKSGRDRFVLLWAAVNFLAIYTPVPFSGRFVLGLVIPVGTLAAYGLERVVLPQLQVTRFFAAFGRLTNTPYDTLRRIFLIATLPSTFMIVLFLLQAPVLRPDFPLYLPAAEVKAAEWLARNGEPDALVLVHYPVGNYLPRLTDSKVFIGQPFLTFDLNGKIALLEKFWDQNTPPNWREDFIREWNITYIYAGEFEKAVTVGEVIPPGEVVYQADTVTIYKVNSLAGGTSRYGNVP